MAGRRHPRGDHNAREVSLARTYLMEGVAGAAWRMAVVAAVLASGRHQGTAHADEATTAGRFHVEHPTLLNLGFEWSIAGDDDRDARVGVTFRKVGDAAWREALPLLR